MMRQSATTPLPQRSEFRLQGFKIGDFANNFFAIFFSDGVGGAGFVLVV